MNKRLPVALIAGVFALAGCGRGEAGEPQGQAVQVAEETVEEESSSSERVSDEPCFTVGDVGSRLSLDWELVVASRDQPDQPEYLEDLMDRGDDFAEDAEPESYPLCKGYQEIADFNYEVAKLNLDVLVDEDTDERYQKIAEIGNELLEISDDEGYEWSYEFVSDVSEID